MSNGANKLLFGNQEMVSEDRDVQKREWKTYLTLGPGTRVAQDRSQWTQLKEAYAKRHTELRDTFHNIE